MPESRWIAIWWTPSSAGTAQGSISPSPNPICGVAADQERRPLIALSSMQVLANAGDSRAMVNVGLLLGQLGRFEEEVEVYDEVVARFGDAPEPAPREQVAKALVNKSIMLGELGRFEEEVEVYDEVVARFGDAPEPAMRAWVAMALVSKGVSLGERGPSQPGVGASAGE